MGTLTSGIPRRRVLQPSRVRCLLIVVTVFLVGSCATVTSDRMSQNCPPVFAPALEPGDSWDWQDDKGANWYRRYVKRTEDGLFEMESRRAEAPKLFYDNTHMLRKVYRDGQWITQATLDFSTIGERVLDFPLFPGKTWSTERISRSSVGDTLTYYQRYRVIGCEQVRVPAGEFSAVVIEEDQGVMGDPTRGSGVRTWWYAPDVKYFIKLVHGHASHSGYWMNFQNWALTSYRVANPPKGAPGVTPAAPSAGIPTPGTAPSVEHSAPQPSATSLPPAKGSAVSLPPSPEVPIWERGYEWKMRWTSPRGSGTFVWLMTGEESVGGISHYVLKTGTREIYYTKADLAWSMERVEGDVESKATPPYRRLAWPLVVGKEWQSDYHHENVVERTTEDRVRTCKVESLEEVTVPAGKFRAFYVVCRGKSQRPADEFWYSPEIRWTVKDKTHFSYGIRERELLEYKLVPNIPSAATPGSGR